MPDTDAAPRPRPSTAWAERIAPDEAERHARAAAGFAAMQAAKSARFGNGRALHRKGLLALRATLRVHENLPAHAAHGLFERPGAHETWVRLSNGGTDVQRDRAPDIRGFSLRELGVEDRGPAALGGPAHQQDFALINRPAFAFPDSRPFVELVMAASRSPVAVLGWALRTYGPLGMFGALQRLKAGFDAPFSGFATEPFHSAAPIACGPYAARVRLVPPPGQAPAAGARDHWAEDVLTRLATGPLVWRLQLQFFVDETRTPIEDASVDWPEPIAPYLDVADLVVEPQDPSSPEGRAFTQTVENAIFDPWAALEAHRPLGEVMRARKAVYFTSQTTRGAG